MIENILSNAKDRTQSSHFLFFIISLWLVDNFTSWKSSSSYSFILLSQMHCTEVCISSVPSWTVTYLTASNYQHGQTHRFNKYKWLIWISRAVQVLWILIEYHSWKWLMTNYQCIYKVLQEYFYAILPLLHKKELRRSKGSKTCTSSCFSLPNLQLQSCPPHSGCSGWNRLQHCPSWKRGDTSVTLQAGTHWTHVSQSESCREKQNTDKVESVLISCPGKSCAKVVKAEWPQT